jgi:hypothetical protein
MATRQGNKQNQMKEAEREREKAIERDPVERDSEAGAAMFCFVLFWLLRG